MRPKLKRSKPSKRLMRGKSSRKRLSARLNRQQKTPLQKSKHSRRQKLLAKKLKIRKSRQLCCTLSRLK